MTVDDLIGELAALLEQHPGSERWTVVDREDSVIGWVRDNKESNTVSLLPPPYIIHDADV